MQEVITTLTQHKCQLEYETRTKPSSPTYNNDAALVENVVTLSVNLTEVAKILLLRNSSNTVHLPQLLSLPYLHLPLHLPGDLPGDLPPHRPASVQNVPPDTDTLIHNFHLLRQPPSLLGYSSLHEHLQGHQPTNSYHNTICLSFTCLQLRKHTNDALPSYL